MWAAWLHGGRRHQLRSHPTTQKSQLQRQSRRSSAPTKRVQYRQASQVARRAHRGAAAPPPLGMMPSPRLGLLMLLHATDAGSTSLMTTSPECQAVMDMWCGTLTQCVARFGLQAKGQWRCYSPSALGDNGTKYLGGPQFCSQDSQLRTVLGICNGTLPQQPYPVPEEGSLPPSQQHGAGGDPAGPLLSTVIMRAGLDQTKCFRIPSVVGPFGSDSPSVLVFAEARENSCADAGSYSLASIRSPDGVNWPSNVRYLFNDTAARQMGSDGINLGASVYDARKKVVHVLFNQCADKFGAAPCGPTASILLLSSSDFGLSWAPLVNLTRQMVAGGFSMLNPGPGTGIQTSTGRLLVPAWGARIGVPKGRKCVGGCDRFWASAIYTDDGIDWKFTAPVPNPLGRKPNELQAALLPNSSIVLNARDEDGLPRLLATSTTDGNTWSPLTPNRFLVGSICQGSMVSAGGVLFFSHPFSRVSRSNGWIKYSVDAGASWWLWRQVEPATFAYSSLTVMHVNASHVTLAVVYEGTDRARGVTGGLLWTTVSDFLPRV